MNQLNVSLQHSITTLAANGWSHRRIARELAIHRETVGRYLRLAEAKPAKVPTGSASDPTAKPAIPLTGSEAVLELNPAIPLTGDLAAGRQSLCMPLEQVIASAVAAGLSAQRIYQDLICDHAFTGKYHSVQRFVRQLLQTQPVPFVRMEVAAGTEAQVDFGQGAWVRVDGKRKRPHLFRIVLSHSRKAYSEVVWRQTTESFIRCLENAFRYFGGVPRTLIPDNLRAAVTRADWYDPELNAKVEEFCRHYGTVMLPTRPAMPQHKGKVEAGVKFAQNNALKGRTFNSLAEQNLFLAEWESSQADTRIHGTTRQQVGKVFQAVEQAKLLPFRHLKTLDDFDWSFNPAVHKKEIFELASCRFIREAKDVLFLGPPGVGKTHLAQAIGYEAIRQNFLVLYRSIFDLVRDFLKDEAFNQQDKTLRRYLKPDLVIIDDMGLKQLPKHAGEYLLEVIMRRYENKATIMTSNRPLEEWGKLLCDVPTAGAIIDRFLHHARVVAITGKSYRVKEAPVITQETKKNKKSNEPATAEPAS